MASQWYIQPAIFAGVPQLISASPSAATAYTLVPYVGTLSVAAPWPCFQINVESGQAVAPAAADATPPMMSGALALPPAPAPATAVGIAIRIVLHGRARPGLWTRIFDVPYHAGDDLPGLASLRAAAAAAMRVHYPPHGQLLRHAATNGVVVPPPTLHLWAMRAGAQLRMLPGEAGGGALGSEDVEGTAVVRAEDPGGDDDERNSAEAEAVRGLLENARDERLGIFLLVNMDGDDSLDVPGHGGRSIGAP